MMYTIKKFISSFFLEPTVVSPETKDLKGTVVLITGGNGGVGRAVSDVLIRNGATVVSLSRSGTPEKNVYAVNADLTHAADVKRAVSEIIQKFGKIDVLINNAGLFLDKSFEDISEKEYDAMMDTNVKGPFILTGLVVPHMKKAKTGLIINIGSKISHNTNVTPKKVMYATTKYALEGFSLALSKELKSAGIRVTCLMLGTVNTFVSFKSKNYLSPHNVGFVISMIIKSKEVDFESILMKSAHQNI